MNCLIILLLLACGGCQNSWGGSCGCGGGCNNCCPRNRDCDNDCPCVREDRGPARCPVMHEEHDCHDHHDHHDHHDDHDCKQGGPSAWNNFPSISGGETCGCDAD